ncbi:hypothetical protein LCGC14_2392930 [marine sediment metagenome]|uniref:Uncharacterized protein n=1 Tax=marine sediment metagenome TaxID=412755 RepID=A0A0F9E9Y4_9ZZZZ
MTKAEDEGDIPCPKCGIPLWFYRIYQEPLTKGEDILNIEYAEWDNEEVACPSCNHKPAYKWDGEAIVLV